MILSNRKGFVLPTVIFAITVMSMIATRDAASIFWLTLNAANCC